MDKFSATTLAAVAMTAVGSSVAAASLLTDYPVMAGQAARYALASLVLFLWARACRARLPRPTPRELGWLAAVAFVGMGGFNVLLIAATARTDPSLVGAIVGTAPVALAVLGALQDRRRPSPVLLSGAALVAVGAVLVEQAQLSEDVIGILLAVAAMLGEVGFSLLAVPVLGRIGPVGVSAHATWLAAIMLAAGAVVFEGPQAFRSPTPAEMSALLYMALVVTAFAFVMWYRAVDVLGADTAGLFAGLIPVSALLASALIGTDELTTLKALGACVVGIGVAIGVRTRRQPTALEAPQAG